MAFSPRSRAVKAKKCTKKSETRAELLFCLSAPIAFLTFSLLSPLSFLKLPNFLNNVTGSITFTFN